MGWFSDAVDSVSNTVNNTINSVGQTISRNTQDFSSVKNVGGAVQKAGKGYVAVVGGALTGAAGLLPQAQSVLTSKTANTVTLGYSGDYAGEQRAVGQLAKGETPNSENTADTLRFGVKSAAGAATFGAASAAYSGYTAGADATEWATADASATDAAEWGAADAATSSGSTLSTIAAGAKTASGYAGLAAGTKYLLSGDLKDAAAAFGIPSNLIGGLPGGQSKQPAQAAGATSIYNPQTPLTNPGTDSTTGFAATQFDFKTLLIPAGIVVGAIIFKRMHK